MVRDFLMIQDFLFHRSNRFFQVVPFYQVRLIFPFFQIHLWVLAIPDYPLDQLHPRLLLPREYQEIHWAQVFLLHRETLEDPLSHLFLLSLVAQMDLPCLVPLEDLRVLKALVVPLAQKTLLLLFHPALQHFL